MRPVEAYYTDEFRSSSLTGVACAAELATVVINVRGFRPVRKYSGFELDHVTTSEIVFQVDGAGAVNKSAEAVAETTVEDRKKTSFALDQA